MNAKALLYIGLPLLILAALYVALKPARLPETPAATSIAPAPPATPAPATAAPAPASATAVQPGASATTAVPAASAADAKAPTAEPAATAASNPAPPAAAPGEATPLVFALVARNNKLVSGPPVIKVQKGDEVTITITSDKADKLHLHGYDLHADLQPGKTATLKFKANLTGRFTYELHRADAELGALEVFPR